MKFNVLLFIILMLFSITTEAQENIKSKPVKNFKRVLIGCNFSPDIAYRVLANNNGDPANKDLINFLNKNEVPKFGFTTGINVCINLSNLLSLETGIQYSNKGYSLKKLFLQSFYNPNLEPGDAIGYSKISYTYHYIDIPFKVNFMVGKKKVRFIGSTGLTANFLIKEIFNRKLKIYGEKSSNKSSPTNDDNNRFNLSPTISAGIDYKINERMNLRIEPTFRFGVIKLISGRPLTRYLWNTGLNISYYFGL